MLDFPLTPRRVSLLNIFAIGLPAFILTLKNKNTAKCVNFSKDVFSFVIISSAVIISAGYMGEYLATKFYTTNRHELELIMISIMIFISIANFIIVAIESGGNKGLFYFYGIILLFIYFILSVIPVNLPYLRFVKIFYEITTINPNYWIPILSISILSSIILFFLHRIRDYFVTVKK